MFLSNLTLCECCLCVYLYALGRLNCIIVELGAVSDEEQYQVNTHLPSCLCSLSANTRPPKTLRLTFFGFSGARATYLSLSGGSCLALHEVSTELGERGVDEQALVRHTGLDSETDC